jgi:GntR family transcriptional regulator
MSLPPPVAEQLGVRSGETAFCVQRLRTVASEPVGYHVGFVPLAFVTYIDRDAFALEDGMAYLHRMPGFEHASIQRTIEASLTTERDRRLLGTEPGVPILQIERVVTVSEGQPIEYELARYRADRFRYQFTV